MSTVTGRRLAGQRVRGSQRQRRAGEGGRRRKSQVRTETSQLVSRVCSDFSSVDRRQHLEADMQRKLDNHERHKAMQAAEYAERADKQAQEEQERNEKFAELNRQSKAKGAQARADYAVKQQE